MSSVAELKAKGNADFAAKRYEEAISHYTAAIEAAKGEADAPHVLYSNRSACYSGLKNYEQALADAEKVRQA
jgi:stress-induced-phosphoprotein 1